MRVGGAQHEIPMCATWDLDNLPRMHGVWVTLPDDLIHTTLGAKVGPGDQSMHDNVRF